MKRRIQSIISILLIWFMIGIVVNPISVNATEVPSVDKQSSANQGDQSDDNAGASGGTSGDTIGNWAAGGWSQNNEGIRIFLIDLDGNVVSNVYDFYFDDCSDIPGEYNTAKGYYWTPELKGKKTAIGNKIAKEPRPISEVDVLNGFPHVTVSSGSGRVSNGQAVINWCLSMDEDGIFQINHVICNIFSDRDKLRYQGEDIYDAYMNDKVKCVIESLYWFVPSKYLGATENGASTVAVNYLDDTDAKYFVYGNIQYIAEQNVKNYSKIHNNGSKNVGGYVSYCGNLWPYAMQLVENEPTIGWGVPAQVSGSVDQNDIPNKNSEGLTSGYGLHIYDVKLGEPVWATFRALTSKYVNGEQVFTPVGGTESPSEAPYMGPATSKELAKRPVKIIKLYQTIQVDQDGNVEVIDECVKHNNDMAACRTIEVQDESEFGYSVAHWWTSATKPNIYKNWETAKESYESSSQKGETPDVVTVTDYNLSTEDYDWLTVHLIKKVYVEIEQKNELVLYESEITNSYKLSELIDGGLFNLSFSYGSMSGTCDYQVKRHAYDEEMIDCDLGCTANGVWGIWKPYHGPGSGAHGYRRVSCKHVISCSNSFTLNSNSDKSYEYKFKNSAALDTSIIANNSVFKPKELYGLADGYKGNVTSINGDDIEVTNLDYAFTLFRGDDKPTLAVYKNTADSAVKNLLGSAQGTNANHIRKAGQGMYTKAVNLKFIGETVDGITKSTCPDHTTKGKLTTHTFDNTSTVNYNSEAKVYYYSGQNKSPATAKPNISTVFTKYFGLGAQGQRVKNGIITSSHMTVLNENGATIKFTPYIKMTYQETGSEDKNEVYVLSQHSSEMKAYSGVTIGWKSNNSNGNNVLVKSDSWSNHAEAVSGTRGWNITNNVLTGGSPYFLGCDGEDNTGSTIYITGYFPVIEQSDRVGGSMHEYIEAPAELFNADNGSDVMETIKQSVIETLDPAYMQLYVDKADNSKREYTAFGGEPASPDGEALGRKLSNDAKYYIRTDVPESHMAYGGLVLGDISSNIRGYEFSADTEGNIYMDNTIILEKGNSIANLTNDTAKQIDSYTKVVTNLVNSITRNKGNDPTCDWGEQWYNEAVEGIYVYVRTISIDVQLADDNTDYGLIGAILDPKLAPAHSGTAEKFKEANCLQYKVEVPEPKTAIIFGNKSIYLKNVDNILVSRPFFISGNVQDVD